MSDAWGKFADRGLWCVAGLAVLCAFAALRSGAWGEALYYAGVIHCCRSVLAWGER